MWTTALNAQIRELASSAAPAAQALTRPQLRVLYASHAGLIAISAQLLLVRNAWMDSLKMLQLGRARSPTNAKILWELTPTASSARSQQHLPHNARPAWWDTTSIVLSAAWLVLQLA